MAALSEFPLVSVITVNQNDTSSTIMFLLELKKATYPSIETWVVDNASTGNDAQLIKEACPTVHVIKTACDKGYAGAFNAVIPKVHGKYILLMQNDVVITPDFIQPLVARCESNYSIGMICPSVLYTDNPSVILYAGCKSVNPISLNYTYESYKSKHSINKTLARETNFGFEAIAMIPFSTMEVCGMLAGAYYSGYDILDWSKRIRDAGYSIWYEPKSVVYYAFINISESPKTARAYYNRLIFLRRNINGWKYIVAIIFLIAFRFPYGFAKELLHGNIQNAKKWIKMYRIFWINILNVEIHDNAFDYS